LGRAFARGLAVAGARVAIAARSADSLADTARLIEGAGGRALILPLDVTDATAIVHAAARIERELGPVDMLVNNAGVMAPLGPDWEVDPAQWWRTFEINVFGAFLCARAVLPGMLERRRGRIVNVSSSAAFKKYPFYSAYGASKAALTSFAASLADATREFGVQVFAFSPGFVRTEMTDALANAPEFRRRLGDGMRRALDEGRHKSMESVVEALLLLVGGQVDALSGRHLDVSDDLLALVREAASGAATH
jgi:NAD(P)-dependent dehydrogenase (short-subunit alcohol dehydrogenase family)